MRDGLQALGQKLAIEDRVHWLGHIPDPVPVLQACDIFLMVSEGEASMEKLLGAYDSMWSS